jgi:uncharacterized protein (UPF0335 family)
MKNMTAAQKEMYEDLKYYMAQIERAATDAKNANMDINDVLNIIKKNLIEDLTK